MHPVLRRVLLHGGLTAGVLALIGAAFAELASVWLAGNAPRNPDPVADAQVTAALRARVPLTLAAWGFLFVLVAELVVWRVRGSRPAAKPPDSTPDETEKLLNELLAQAESKLAAPGGAPHGEGPPPTGRGENVSGSPDPDRSRS